MPIQGQRFEWPDDDGERPLSDEEAHDRMYRVSGDCVCKVCGKTYWKHPDEVRLTWIHLKRLCNGWLGKL